MLALFSGVLYYVLISQVNQLQACRVFKFDWLWGLLMPTQSLVKGLCRTPVVHVMQHWHTFPACISTWSKHNNSFPMQTPQSMENYSLLFIISSISFFFPIFLHAIFLLIFFHLNDSYWNLFIYIVYSFQRANMVLFLQKTCMLQFNLLAGRPFSHCQCVDVNQSN